MSAAARQKLRRSREARGLAVYGVEVGGDVLNGLEMAGLLRERDFRDREAVADGLAAALSDWAKRVLESRVTAIATGRGYDGARKERS